MKKRPAVAWQQQEEGRQGTQAEAGSSRAAKSLPCQDPVRELQEHLWVSADQHFPCMKGWLCKAAAQRPSASSVNRIRVHWKEKRRNPGWLHLIQLLSMHYLLLLGQRLRSQPIKAIVITSLQRLQTAELNDRFPVQQLLRLLKWRSRSVGIAENMLPPYVRGKRCSPSGWKRRRRGRREEAWMWDRNLCSNEASKAIKGGQRCKAVLIALLQWVGAFPTGPR